MKGRGPLTLALTERCTYLSPWPATADTMLCAGLCPSPRGSSVAVSRTVLTGTDQAQHGLMTEAIVIFTPCMLIGFSKKETITDDLHIGSSF